MGTCGGGKFECLGRPATLGLGRRQTGLCMCGAWVVDVVIMWWERFKCNDNFGENQTPWQRNSMTAIPKSHGASQPISKKPNLREGIIVFRCL